jgi:AcrR family transcriptional regulator
VAASQVFAEEGFAGARVDQIAAAAGVNKALLYYHVGNKQDLYTSVLIRNFDRVDHAISRAAKYEGSARNRLGKIVAAVTTVLKDHPDHPRIVLREFASAGTNLQPQVLERIIKILTTVREVLSSGIRDGEFRATDPVLTHITLVGASLFLNAVTPLRERIAEIGGPGIGLPAEDSDFGGFLTDLLLHGITTPTSGESE